MPLTEQTCKNCELIMKRGFRVLANCGWQRIFICHVFPLRFQRTALIHPHGLKYTFSTTRAKVIYLNDWFTNITVLLQSFFPYHCFAESLLACRSSSHPSLLASLSISTHSLPSREGAFSSLPFLSASSTFSYKSSMLCNCSAWHNLPCGHSFLL